MFQSLIATSGAKRILASARAKNRLSVTDCQQLVELFSQGANPNAKNGLVRSLTGNNLLLELLHFHKIDDPALHADAVIAASRAGYRGGSFDAFDFCALLMAGQHEWKGRDVEVAKALIQAGESSAIFEDPKGNAYNFNRCTPEFKDAVLSLSGLEQSIKDRKALGDLPNPSPLVETGFPKRRL